MKKERLAEIEANIAAMRPISELVAAGASPETLVEAITKGDHEFVEHLDLKYACDCSWDKFANGLVALGRKELEAMSAEALPVETVCQFCGKKYAYQLADLEKIMERANKEDEAKEKV